MAIVFSDELELEDKIRNPKGKGFEVSHSVGGTSLNSRLSPTTIATRVPPSTSKRALFTIARAATMKL